MGFKKSLFYAVVFLFFFQLLAEFIEAVYAFGLLATSVPPEMVAVLLLFSPVLLLPFRRLPRSLPDLLLALVLVTRVLMPLPGTYGRMLLAGLGTAAWLLLFLALLRLASGREAQEESPALASGVMIAVAASAFLRTLASGLDFSTVGWGQVVGWILAAMAAWLWWGERVLPKADPEESYAGGVFLPALGITAVFALLYFVFTAPHVLSRWTGSDYRWILALFAAAILGWGWVLSRGVPRGATYVASSLLVIALSATARVHQVSFPKDPNAYPIPEVTTGWWHSVPLVATLLLYPVLFVSFAWLVGRVLVARPSPRRLGGSFALAMVFLLVLIFAHVFTTTYDYIPVVGPFFRDRFWQVHLVAGLGLLVALLPLRGLRWRAVHAVHTVVPTVAVLGLASVVAALAVTARPVPPTQARNEVTVLTYNVQQGYSKDGRRNFEGQLEVIRSAALDIVGLQETDNARIANGNADIVRYFANHLNMYAYYGPKTVTGTFGIALLSRYPIEHPRTWFLYSEGEQVAAIEAVVRVGGRPLHVFVTHLGNEGPLIQQKQFLALLRGKENVIAMGDFNFRPDSEQYRLTTEVLVDTWTARWPEWEDDRGIKPTDKIDHIFVSPDLQVIDARYIPPGPSDHPAMVAVIGW